MKFGESEFWLQVAPTQVKTTASSVDEAIAGRCEAGEKLIKETAAESAMLGRCLRASGAYDANAENYCLGRLQALLKLGRNASLIILSNNAMSSQCEFVMKLLTAINL